jgi:protein O-mannosyl-transferase
MSMIATIRAVRSTIACRDVAAKSSQATRSVACRLFGHIRKGWVRIALLFVTSVLVRAPALQGEFIWDDQYLARDNPLIKSPLLVFETLRHYLFLDSFSTHYRPLQNISFIFDYFLWNTNTFGFHLTNVLLHGASGVLLYFLLRHLFSSLVFRRASYAVRARAIKRLPWVSLSALLVATIWVVHPVHSAAVDYISGRADSLAFLFACGGWLLFIQAQQASRRSWQLALFSLAGFSGLLALLSREIAGIWIALFLAHLIFVERRKCVRLRTRICAVVSCLAVVTIYLGLHHLPAERATAAVYESWSPPVRAVLMARALGDYARLLAFPQNLHMERTVFNAAGIQSNADWRQTIGIEYLDIVALLFLAVLIGGSIKRGHTQPIRIFGASWFMAGYLPVSNLIQLNATVAEHWLYLPSVGFFVFIAGCALELPRRFRHALVVCAISAVIGLGIRSFARSTDWVDEATFYQRTLVRGGTSGRVIANLARIYAERHDYAAAERMLRRVLQASPDYSIALNNLADLLYHQGKMAEAETLFHRSAEVGAEQNRYPRPWIAAVNFAILRHKAKDDEQALTTLAKERAAHPNVWDIVSYESEMLRQSKGPDAALPLVKDFVRANWWHYGAALALGRLYAQKGDVDLADSALRHASRLDVHDAQALSLVATISMEQNRLDDAYRIQRRAIARQPDEPRQYILLSNILEKMGRDEEARAALAHVSHLRELAQPDKTLLN